MNLIRRSYTAVSCDPKHEVEVMVEIRNLYQRLLAEHPEWGFDFEPDWEWENVQAD